MKNNQLSIMKIWKLFEFGLRRVRVAFMLGVLILGALDAFAQAPNAFTFQGVARDASGKVMANQDVDLDVAIYRGQPGQPGSTFLTVDQIFVTTNSNGVFTGTISGAALGPLKAEILANGNYYLGIKIFGSTIDLGTTQLLSVPFALVANKLPDLDPIAQIGQAGSGKSLNTDLLNSAAPSFIWYPKKNTFKVGTGAQNEDSFAEGSIALGTGVLANVTDGTALGRFNDLNTDIFQTGELQRLFQIGNGSASNNRKNALTILKNGNVGIGSNVLEPGHLLDLGGRMRIKYANNQTAGIFLDGNTTKEAAFVGMKQDTEVGFFIGGNWQFWINSGGDGRIQGILHSSDRRLKRDFSPITNSLTKLNNLEGQHYYWKDTTRTQQLQTGLIAQDVEQYFPELVNTDEKGFKSVNYIGLIPHLIESVKALKAKDEEFAALQKELVGYKNLQTQIDELKAELSKQAASANPTNQTTQGK
jgi:hypothetical protein